MFRSATDHRQGVYVFLVKITELKCVCSYVVRHACLTTPDTTYKQNMLCCRITTLPHMNTHILIQRF
jgi:hypothetical protein